MTAPNDPGQPGQGWAPPSWGQPASEQAAQPAAPGWNPEPPTSGWPHQPPTSGWAAPPTLVAPTAPTQEASSTPAAPAPMPPATLVVAAVLTVLGAVSAVLLALNEAGDLLDRAGWRAADADALPALLLVPLLAALVGGAFAALAGRGGGLLLAGGIVLAVAAGAVAVGSGLVDDVQGGRIALAAVTAVAGLVIAVLAAVAPSKRWYRSAQRRSAERVVARVLAGPSARRDQVAGAAAGWLIAAAVLAVATVGAAALVLAGQSGDDEGGEGSGFASGGDSSSGSSSVFGAGSIPVDEDDDEYDSYFHGLAEDCQDGDLASCDDLYYDTPVGSDYEYYAKTCGGRTSADYYGNCAEDFD